MSETRCPLCCRIPGLYCPRAWRLYALWEQATVPLGRWRSARKFAEHTGKRPEDVKVAKS